ncbi:MAG: NUDIX domain-containing protein [Pseudonocardiaceae bacterium]
MTASSPVLPVDQYVARLAKKRMAAGVLFRDRSGRVLLLKTSYKPNLEVPGGAVQADEAPWATATREVAEELGWDRPVGRLLVVDYVFPQDSRPEGVVFLFDGGVLDETDVAGMVFGDGEVVAAEFQVLEDARSSMKPLVADRLAAGLEAAALGVTVLCEHGRRIG